MNIVDSSGWIEYFFEGPNASFFAKPIERTDELLVPVICLYEVFKKISQVADETRALKAFAQMQPGRGLELNENVALKGASIGLKYKLAMADSFIYAMGQIEEAIVWTQDRDFQGLPGVQLAKAKKTPPQ